MTSAIDLEPAPCPGCADALARALASEDPHAWFACTTCEHQTKACVGCRDAKDYLRRTLAVAPTRGARGKAGPLASVVCDLCGDPVALDELGAERTLAKEAGRARAATARLRREAVVRALELLERWEPEMHARAVGEPGVGSGNTGGGAKTEARDRSAKLDAGSDADAIRHAYAVRDRLARIAARGREASAAQRLRFGLALAEVLARWPARPGGDEDRARTRRLARQVGKLEGDRDFADEIHGRRDARDAAWRWVRLLDLGWTLAFIVAHRDALHALAPLHGPSDAERAAAVLGFIQRRRLRPGETWALVLGWHFVDDETRRKWEPPAPRVTGSSERERADHAEAVEHGLERRKRHGQELLDLAVDAWFGE